MNFCISCTFTPQKSNHYTLLFLGAYDKWSSHVDATSGEGQQNGESCICGVIEKETSQ
jgi:hypothetical protein